jgi:hypothetical protein
MISWKSKKKLSIALSMKEAEYIVACSTSCEAIWIREVVDRSIRSRDGSNHDSM